MKLSQRLFRQWQFCVLFTFLILGGIAIGGTLREDLASSTQTVRDAAAGALRKSYSPPRSNDWTGFLQSLKPGVPKATALDQFRKVNAVGEEGSASGNGENQAFRLDDMWRVQTSFTNIGPNSGLESFYLEAQMKSIWIEPPTNFTGLWITYWPNGQTNYVYRYRDGKIEGNSISFHTNGIRGLVYEMNKEKNLAEETSFYPSGTRRHTGAYSNHVATGVWTWYNEDGTVQSQIDHSNPDKPKILK